MVCDPCVGSAVRVLVGTVRGTFVKRVMRWMYLNEHSSTDAKGKPVKSSTYDMTPSSESSKRVRVAYYKAKGQQ